ncbi:MAG: hypothetical protein HQK50_19450, partial [Oligoflexia bacterium]|nr:hypothetical protein [Oligoflexia bacterium]
MNSKIDQNTIFRNKVTNIFYPLLCMLLLQLLLLGITEQSLFAQSITKKQFVSEIRKRAVDVPEFFFIREWALNQPKESRPQVFLFGGAATAYATYIHRHLKKGDLGGAGSDIDISDIYDLVQDVDIVIDGTPEQAQELQQQLDKNFPRIQGNSTKSLWEVRPLRHQLGPKEALLSNSEIAYQHTDSLSSGFIEITQNNPKHRPEIHDLKKWSDGTETKHLYPFVNDILEGHNNYRFNPKHGETARAKNGMNPPIISVLRYFIKCSQYGMYDIPDDSKKVLKDLISKFNSKDLDNDYVQTWLAYNVKKLITNASDLNKTWEMLDEFGLRKLLSSINYTKEESSTSGLRIADWFKKEPIAEMEIKKNSSKQQGVTLEQYLTKLGYKQSNYLEDGVSKTGWMLAHEVRDYYAFNSMTKNPENKLNGFISRQGVNGEAAVAGNGFYVAIGNQGASTGGHTGLTIHLVAEPSAIEGVDFTKGAQNNHLVIKNRNMVSVIHDDIALTPSEFFTLIKDGKFVEIDPDADQAVKMKLEQTLVRRLKHLGDRDMEKLFPVVAQALREGKAQKELKLFPGTILSHAISLKTPATMLDLWLKDYFKSKEFTLINWNSFFNNPNFATDPSHQEQSLKLLSQALSESASTDGLNLGNHLLRMYLDYFKQPLSSQKNEIRSWLTSALKNVNLQTVSPSDRSEILSTILGRAKSENISVSEDRDVLLTIAKEFADDEFKLSLYKISKLGFESASSLLDPLLTPSALESIYKNALVHNDLVSLKDLLGGVTISAERQKEQNVLETWQKLALFEEWQKNNDNDKDLFSLIQLGVDHFNYHLAPAQVESILLHAIKDGNSNTIQFLEKSYSEEMKSIVPAMITKEGSALLREALSTGKEGISLWLQQKGVSIKDGELLPYTMMTFPKEKNLEIIQGSSSWDVPWSKSSPLYLAMKRLSSPQMHSPQAKTRQDYLDLRELTLAMIAQAKNSLSVPPSSDSSPLGLAVKMGDVEVVKKILGKGVKLSSDPVLFEALASGNLELFKLLLLAGADPKIPNGDGKTLLMVLIEKTNAKN